jgi:hypothetical protein
MRARILLVLPLLFLAAEGCQKSNPLDSRASVDSTTIYYQINGAGMRPLRNNEYYVLWMKILPDTSWKMISPLKLSYFSSSDTATFYGKFSIVGPLDNVQNVLITLEQTSNPSVTGLPLVQSSFFLTDTSKKKSVATFDSKHFLGDFSALQGGLVFTSLSTDSLAYRHEFYLMNYRSPSNKPSLLSLPLPPSGWKYGLWAVDSNFTPHQNFFYGLFSTPAGHDSDSANDSFPFPGGSKPQRMDMSSGSIIVTLEPEFYANQLKYKGCSPFTLLRFDRTLYTRKNKNYPMVNVASSGLPGGWIMLSTY